MSDKSAIEWTDATWNPIVGCSIVSPGCTNCYAMKMAARIQKMNRTGGSGSAYVNHYDGTTEESKAGAVWTGKVALAPDKLFQRPLSWKRGRRIFVNSMGDLFHESIPDEWIDRVFAVMALCPQHTFQVLTKRPERMRAYFARPDRIHQINGAIHSALGSPRGSKIKHGGNWRAALPLTNVWLGVSAERQQEADERIPLLLQTPAAVRFVSLEPLLGPIDLTPKADSTYQRVSEWYGPNGFDPTGSRPRRARMGGYFPRLDWVIVGGESGPNARLLAPAWARSLRDQCEAAGAAFFYKQWGEFAPVEISVEEFTTPEPQHIGESCVTPAGFFVNFPVDYGDRRTWIMRRVGKKRAGRLLDGVEHSAFPSSAPMIARRSPDSLRSPETKSGSPA